MYMANTYESCSHGACMRSHLLTKVGNLSLALSVTIYKLERCDSESDYSI